MTAINLAAARSALALLPQTLRGPGGVAGILHEGKVIDTRVWGYASLETGQEMTAQTRLPLCSISKQFTCMTMLAACGSPEALDARLPAHLPNFKGDLPKVRDLANNQSGLRDYWALTILHGAKAEQFFPKDDASRVFARMQSTHFAPGSHYSYNNGNFRLIADLLEAETGESFEALLKRHVLEPAGMTGAYLAADTRTAPDGLVGYEGREDTGYLPAENGVWWMGDAGMAASLNDMLAYEAWIDANRHAGLYTQAAEAQSFVDGAPAHYGMGLQYHSIGGDRFTGHGGALRGFRLYRIAGRDSRFSVVVLLNHEGDAHGAAHQIARAALGMQPMPSAPVQPHMQGQWICEQTGLLAKLTPQQGSVRLNYGTGAEGYQPQADGSLASGLNRIEFAPDGTPELIRPLENFRAKLVAVAEVAQADPAPLTGRWVCDELEVEMEITAAGGMAYARFTGILGTGRPEMIRAAGPDLWQLLTRRSLDAPAPGDWTLRLERDASGAPEVLHMSCWLARHLRWRKV